MLQKEIAFWCWAIRGFSSSFLVASKWLRNMKVLARVSDGALDGSEAVTEWWLHFSTTRTAIIGSPCTATPLFFHRYRNSVDGLRRG